jgi:hypothetical protein
MTQLAKIAVSPPSTGIVAPVTQLDSSYDRNSITDANSNADAPLPRALAFHRLLLMKARSSSV